MAMWGSSLSPGNAEFWFAIIAPSSFPPFGPLHVKAVDLPYLFLLFSMLGPIYSRPVHNEIFILSRLEIQNYFTFLQCMEYSFGDKLTIFEGREENKGENSISSEKEHQKCCQWIFQYIKKWGIYRVKFQSLQN